MFRAHVLIILTSWWWAHVLETCRGMKLTYCKTKILCIRLVNYWDKYTGMQGQQNIKILFLYVVRLRTTNNNIKNFEFNNCPTRCDLFSLLHFCRQLYMFRVLTTIIRSSYSCNCSFWYWLTGSTTIRSCCRVGTDSRVSYGRYS